jgi:hypothetical protein
VIPGCPRSSSFGSIPIDVPFFVTACGDERSYAKESAPAGQGVAYRQ